MTHEFHLQDSTGKITTVTVTLDDDFPEVTGIARSRIGPKLEFMLRRIANKEVTTLLHRQTEDSCPVSPSQERNSA
jgi:hypothetical protein